MLSSFSATVLIYYIHTYTRMYTPLAIEDAEQRGGSFIYRHLQLYGRHIC